MTDQKYRRDFERDGFVEGDPVPLSIGHLGRHYTKEFQMKAEFDLEYKRLRDAVIVAAKVWSAIRAKEPRLHYEPGYSMWQDDFDNAVNLFDNAASDLLAFERAHGIGENK